MTTTDTDARLTAADAVDAALATIGRPQRRGGSEPYRQRHSCPPWCETADHNQGEFTHRCDREVVTSLHPMQWPDVDGARSAGTVGLEAWFQQNHTVTITLEDPPGACEPFLVVEGHHGDDGKPGVPQQTRLTLAEGLELARILTALVTVGRS